MLAVLTLTGLGITAAAQSDDGASSEEQLAKLIADDAQDGDLFGSSVAIEGDTALIGASSEDEGGDDAGAAYVFTRTEGDWSQQAKLIANDAQTNDDFGDSVAIEGDTALIGAPEDEEGGDRAGAAYVFTRTGGGWSQQAKLIANDAEARDQFRFSVAIEGDTALIGARFEAEGGDDAGAAYVFTRTDGTWSQQAKLIADDAQVGDQFGFNVAIEGDTALIGAPYKGEGGDRTGAAYVFDGEDEPSGAQDSGDGEGENQTSSDGESTGSTPWTQLHGGPAHLGVAPARAPDPGAGWSIDLGGVGGLAADDNRIYVTATYEGSHKLLALEPPSQEPVWTYEVAGEPLVSHGQVFVTDGEGRVHAVDKETGEKFWETQKTKSGSVHPAIAGKYLVTAANNYDEPGQLAVVDLERGEIVRVEEDVPVEGIAARSGTVYYTTETGSVVKLLSGDKTVSIGTVSKYPGVPAVASNSNTMYVPMQGELTGLSTKTGEQERMVSVEGYPGAPVLGDERIYLATQHSSGERDNTRVYAWEPNETTPDWTQSKLDWTEYPNPVLVGDRLVIVTNSNVSVLDRRDGTIIEKHKLGGFPTAAPIVSGSTIFVGTDEGLQTYRLGAQAHDWNEDKQSAEDAGEDEANDNQNWKLKLAKRFSPVLAFHSEEVYRPMPADYALERSDMRNHNGNLLREGPIQIPPTTDEFNQAFLDNKHIPLGPSGPDGESASQSPDITKKAFRSAADDYPVTVHARVLYTSSPDQPEEDDRWDAPDTKPPSSTRIIKDPDVRLPDSTVIQYWIYYPYNDWINQHEGEWEMVQVNLPGLLGPSDVEKTDLPVPSSVFYSIHHGGAALDWDDDNLRTAEDLVEDGYALPPPSEVDAGPSVFPYQEKPAVVVAKGSHASYPNEHYGRMVCSDAAEDLEIGDILVDYELEIIEEDDPSWVGFPGSWGAVPQATNAPDADGPGPQPDPQLGWGPGPPGPQFSEARDIRPGIDATNKWEAPLSWAGAQSSGKIICNASGSSLLAEDDQGRQVGFDGDRVKSEIPGAVPLAVSKGQVDDEVEIYYLPDGHNYTVEIDGYTTAKANLTMSSLKGGQAEITRFESVPVSAQYRGSFDVPNEGPPSPIQEDTDGDGEVDNVREPTSHETVELSSAAAEADGIGLGTIPQFVLFVLILAGGAGLAVWLSRR